MFKFWEIYYFEQFIVHKTNIALCRTWISWVIDVKTYLRTGLERAIGVATPRALIRCCMVGVAEVIRIAAPCWFIFGPLIIWSGDSASGLYPRDTSRPLLCYQTTKFNYANEWSQNKREKILQMDFFVVVLVFMMNANEIQRKKLKESIFFLYTQDNKQKKILYTKK